MNIKRKPPAFLAADIARWRGPDAADDVVAQGRRREGEREMNARDKSSAASTDAGAGTPYRPALSDGTALDLTVDAIDETGARRGAIAGEHPLTLYVDKREI